MIEYINSITQMTIAIDIYISPQNILSVPDEALDEIYTQSVIQNNLYVKNRLIALKKKMNCYSNCIIIVFNILPN